jgi:UbiA prenyltransferase family
MSRGRFSAAGHICKLPVMIAHLWTEMRPVQWAKNLAVFAPLLFAQPLVIPSAFARALFAFVLFCGSSSAVCLLNDVLDYEQDRAHSEKRDRPLAAGHLTRGTVLGASGVLLIPYSGPGRGCVGSEFRVRGVAQRGDLGRPVDSQRASAAIGETFITFTTRRLGPVCVQCLS